MKHSAALLVALALITASCKNTYYSAWEKLGWEKRDILVDRVQDAHTDQEKAKEQFKTTLQRFQELTNFQGGELEAKYNKLSSEYERCKSRAEAVSERIAAVDTVARDMFKEWKAELKQYESAELRRASEQKMNDAQKRYGQLIEAMRRAESKMPPVLRAFHDQVLFLKHNLNAAAISSLSATTAEINDDVQTLVKEMEASIAEADAFIKQLKS